jgi:hypothetical protein
LAKLPTICCLGFSEKLLRLFQTCESLASKGILDFGKPTGVFDLATGLPIKIMADSSSIGGDSVTTTSTTLYSSKN